MSINPDEVPAFPAYFLRLDTETDTATLEGVRVEPAAGTSIRQAALQAVATKAQTHGLTAVRVTLEDQEADRWKMIVAANGEAIDITTDETEEQPQAPQKRRTRLVLGSATAVVILGGAIAGGAWIITSLTGTDADTGPPPWEIPGEDEEIPIAVPEGYAQTAAWSVETAEDSGAIQIDDGRIINTHTDGTLLARDPDTAEPTWQGTDAPDDVTDLHQVRWNDQPALSLVDNNTLYIWALGDELEADPTEPVTFDLSNDAEVSYAQTPLIDLGDFIVAVPTDDGLTQVNIPVGTDPVAATDEEVISIDADQIYRTPLNGDETTTNDYERHSDSSGRADALWPITETVVLGQWNDEDGDPMLQAIDITTGERLVSTTSSTTPGDDPEITVDDDNEHALIDDVTLSYGTDSAFGSIPTLTEPVLNNGTVYGNTQNGPARIGFPEAGDDDLHPDDDALTHWETFTDDDAAPRVVTDEAIYVQASRLDETLLYRADFASDDDEAIDQDSDEESEDNDASDEDQSDEDD